MTPARARPSMTHYMLLCLLERWRSRLDERGLRQHAQFDSARRFLPTAFLVADRIRLETGNDVSVAPVYARFLDWMVYPEFDFFNSPSLEQAIHWLTDAAYIEIEPRRDTNYSLTAQGERAVTDAMLLGPEFGSNLPASIGPSHPIVTEAIADTVETVAILSTADFRDYLLTYSFRLYNEGVAHPLIDFDKRYKLVEWVNRRGHSGPTGVTYHAA